MALRVALDATGWLNRRGYGRCARGLLGALLRIDTTNCYTCFVDRAEARDALPAGVEVRVVPTRAPAAIAASARGRRSLPDLYRMSRAVAAGRFDVVLFPNLHTYVPVAGRARKIVAVHDVIPEAFPHLALGTLGARLAWACKSAAARRQADAIVTVSEFSRREILRRWNLDARRVHVVGEAADPVFRPLSDPPPSTRLAPLLDGAGRIVTFVGGFSPHKNVDRLITAFETTARDRPDARLLLVGELESEAFTSALPSLRRQVDRSAMRDRIVFTGHLPDEDLAVLLNRTTVLALPSMMEGFGLPAVEAAACGCPVIATTRSPLPELLGEAALYVHPHDRTDLERALARVLDAPAVRERMGAAGIEAAGRLSWSSAALRLKEVIEESAERA